MKRLLILLVMMFIVSMGSMFGGIKASAGCVNGGTDVMDNDNNSMNSTDNEVVGPWQYQSSSNSFRGDHRYLAAPPSSWTHEYGWNYADCSGLYGNVYAYIWDTKFTNEQASYRMSNYSSGSPDKTLNIYLNQRTAPGGWNYLGKTTQAKTGYLGLIVPSGASGSTGADGTKVVYSTY